MDSSTSKAQLRSHVRSARADRARAEAATGSARTVTGGRTSVSPAEVAPGSARTVADAAWEVISSRPVRSLLAYASLSGEPDLDPAIDRFLASGGTVFLPVVTKVGEPLAFGEVTGSMGTLEPQGKWGIREPQGGAQLFSAEELVTTEVGLDLVFVPALGFGTDGARLGNGGGFYDRTFGPHGVAPLDRGNQAEAETGSRMERGSSVEMGPRMERGSRVERESAPTLSVPRVVGVCFASELGLTGLIAEDWDLRIPAAITEAGLHTFDPA
ncbi:5-formyltetrahydrofolate cyclo-ligase [Brevibacterium oceani]|uniref:5-formyltetrahydrofolate cyclo-ligase n=1 Tax=Brevibacterium oceani TaxID=358099 RepID=UPI002811F211|nr:5-formyltetrahydrofolate cyclo-ligase [Brevibacterium oceani]